VHRNIQFGHAPPNPLRVSPLVFVLGSNGQLFMYVWQTVDGLDNSFLTVLEALPNAANSSAMPAIAGASKAESQPVSSAHDVSSPASSAFPSAAASGILQLDRVKNPEAAAALPRIDSTFAPSLPATVPSATGISGMDDRPLAANRAADIAEQLRQNPKLCAEVDKLLAAQPAAAAHMISASKLGEFRQTVVTAELRQLVASIDSQFALIDRTLCANVDAHNQFNQNFQFLGKHQVSHLNRDADSVASELVAVRSCLADGSCRVACLRSVIIFDYFRLFTQFPDCDMLRPDMHTTAELVARFEGGSTGNQTLQEDLRQRVRVRMRVLSLVAL
jgi:hypothetical protein